MPAAVSHMALVAARTPLVKWNSSDKGASVTLSNSDRTMVKSGAGFQSVRSVQLLRNLGPKLYFEVSLTVTYAAIIGIANASATLTNYVGSDANGWGFQFNATPTFYNNGSGTAYGSAAGSAGSIGMIAMDLVNQKMWAGVDGTWLNSGNPDSGTNNMGFGTAIPATGGYFAAASQLDETATILLTRTYTTNATSFLFVPGGP